MWILAIKRPYYPSVEEFETREEAFAAAEDWLADNAAFVGGGQYDSHVYIAEVAIHMTAKSDY